MKKNLLLMMLCCPIILAAQNGVTVSGLAINAGTVTFNVSWKNIGMPSLWSDTVWVFVDYNNAGKMERLPLLSGATLTATSPGGEVIEEPDNNKGVWVAGNARDAGAFSATVQLLTAVKDAGGVCVYGSNYPPVGEYSSATNVSFMGTPIYEISLAGSDGSNITVKSGDRFLLPCDYTLTSFTDATGAPGIIKDYCTAPGSTVNFTAFSPCSDAATGDYWYLTDTREQNNIQTYKVKKMPDGHIWMVQDMKFGDKCNKTDFTGSTSDQTSSKLTSISGYVYGDCRNNTQSKAGYLYNWAATIQKAEAYNGSSTNPGCSGTATGTTSTNPGACRGICPDGWHIPTGNTTGEFYDLHTNYNRGCATNNDDCWDADSDWEGVFGGWCLNSGSLDGQGSYAHYWSSTYNDSDYAYNLYFYSSTTYPGTRSNTTYYGRSVRCVRNY